MKADECSTHVSSNGVISPKNVFKIMLFNTLHSVLGSNMPTAKRKKVKECRWGALVIFL